MPSVLYLGNTMVLRLEGLRNRDGELVTGADVNLIDLIDSDGDDVAASEGITLPLPLVDQGGGNYEAQLPAISDLEAGANLFGTVHALVGGATDGEWVERFMVRERSA